MTCKVCEWIWNPETREKDKIRVIYEDEKTFVILSDKPKAIGHILIFPKEHYNDIKEVPQEEVPHYFYAASFSATAVFEGLKAQGTNIIANNGPNSERRFDHFCIQVLPRSQEDGIDLKWEPKKELDLDSIKSRIEEKTFAIGKEDLSKKAEEKTEEKNIEKIEAEEGEENYMIKQLERIP